jgi:hypothetical protein
MARRKSKLRAMAAQGNLWAIETLAKAQRPVVHDAAMGEAMRDARDILEWTLGRKVPSWRVYRLAQALRG